MDLLVLSARARLVIAVMVMAAGMFVIALGSLSYLRGRALAREGVATEATLVATEHRVRDSETGHQVRYRFRVGDREFQRFGVFGTPVASDITAAELERARSTGRVLVRYVPSDPSINEPLSSTSPQVARNAIAVGIGCLMLLVGALRLFNARLAQADADD